MQNRKYLSDGCETRFFESSDRAFYIAEQKKLKEAGYALYAENEIDGNLFSTFVSGENLVQLYFTPCDGCVRVITDKNTRLYLLHNECDKKCSTVLWQFETDHSMIDCGMCYIIRCADGSFFIIDSAHMYSVNDDERIYNFLRERTPENEKIVISGWFLSHAHDDHVMKFMDFLKYRAADVEIECIYCNFPSVEYCDNGSFMESTLRVIDAVNIFLESGKYAPKVTLHSGQRFAVRNLVFTVLCTHEDVYPHFIDNFNDSSTVLMLETENTKIFFPGDAGELESIILEKRYPQYLKSDILQVAHHGHFGLRTSCYELVNASVALFPTTRIKFDEEYEKIEADRRAVELSQLHFVSSEGTVEIPLPPGNAPILRLPDETNEDFNSVYNLWGYEYAEDRKTELTAAFEKRKNGGDESFCVRA